MGGPSLKLPKIDIQGHAGHQEKARQHNLILEQIVDRAAQARVEFYKLLIDPTSSRQIILIH